jgi:hypothetical protein
MVNKGVATAVALLAVMVGLNMSGVVTIDFLKESLNHNRVGGQKNTCVHSFWFSSVQFGEPLFTPSGRKAEARA